MKRRTGKITMATILIQHPAMRTRRVEPVEFGHDERNWTLTALTLATAAAYWSNAASFLLVVDISGNIGASFVEGA